jgi:hypothetical protein
MIYMRTKDLNSSFKIYMGHTKISGFEYDKETLKETKYELIEFRQP